MSALELFGVVPLEPGMTSPAPGTTLVPFRSLAAVAAPAPYRRVSADENTVAAYALVVETIYRQMPILPAPPGTIFRSQSVLSRWLELHYVALIDSFGALEGNVTARVTIRLRSAEANEDTLKEWQELANESLRALRGQADDNAVPGLGDGEPAVLARSSFLIERQRWDAFESSVRAEGKRHPHLDFALTGPWPPYDFVRMQLGN